LPYENRKNRAVVFFRTVFRHFLPVCLSLMPKNRSVYQAAGSNSVQKRPNVKAPIKIAGVSEKMGVGPNGMGDPYFFG
jgi:hypothetical protein